MVPSMITVKFIVLLLSLLQNTSYAQNRKLISEINPGCDTCDGNSTLVYVKAIGVADTIHEIWDFTRGAPTIIFVIAGQNSSINIIWDGIKPEKFLMSEPPFYSFATSIDKLYEYNDLGDVVIYDWHMPQRKYSLKDVSWRLTNKTLNENEAMIAMRGKLCGRLYGVIDIKLELLPFRDSATELPHLIHTENSTQCDVSLVNLTSTEWYNSSRFAVHMVYASTDSSKDEMRLILRKTLDDEHTPGIFETVEIRTPHDYSVPGEGGFLQFRPVAYTQSERSVATSTMTHFSELDRATLPEKSTLSAFYDGFDTDMLLVEEEFISFGVTGDGFYKEHNYTSWSFSIGLGYPPVEGFSPFVVIVLALGISLPIALAFSGIMYVVVKKFTQLRNRNRLVEEY